MDVIWLDFDSMFRMRLSQNELMTSQEFVDKSRQGTKVIGVHLLEW
jgi:hypothetical protein